MSALNVSIYFQQAEKTALHYAVKYQNTKVVQILIDLGADVNEVSTIKRIISHNV